MKLDPLLYRVVYAYQDLQRSLDSLCSEIREPEIHNSAIYLTTESSEYHKVARASATDKIKEAYRTLTYNEFQDPRETFSMPGYLECSSRIIALGGSVNEAKDNFKKSILEFKKASNSFSPKQLSMFHEEVERATQGNNTRKRDVGTKKALQRFGLSRLNLKQCYRHIPILESHPESIGWTWITTSSIKKVSKTKAISMLKGLESNSTQEYYLELLEMCQDTEFALVQNLAPQLKANIVYVPNENRKLKKRALINASLPILLPGSTDITLRHNTPPARPSSKSTRLPRSDRIIEPAPYIEAIRLHRYVENL